MADEKKSSKLTVLAIVAVVIGGCCIFGGIVAAIAIPNYRKFTQRSKQAEAKVLLKSIYVAEKATYADKSVYSENANEANVMLESGRYVCVLARGGTPLGKGPDVDELAAGVRSQVTVLGVSGHCPSCDFTAACGANLDADPELDIWSISSADRTVNGQTVGAGTPFNDFSDVTDSPGR